jgi:putative nucleotidyltransferase with HDIG domain
VKPVDAAAFVRSAPTDLPIDSPKARETHRLAIDRTRVFFDEVKNGKSLAPETIAATVDSLVAEVIVNQQAFSNLSILKMKDEYTYVHSVDVAILSALIGMAMNLPKNDLFTLAMAGLLHDVGKMLVPADILGKPSALTDDEMAQMKKHSFLGYKLLKRENIDERIANCVLEHHEWVNGKGYPFGKTGINLDDFSKVIAVCDVYTAITSDRPYKKAMEPFKAVKVVVAEAGTHLDAETAKLFQRVVGIYPNGTIVRLSNGSICRVVGQNINTPLRPQLQVLRDVTGKDAAATVTIDLASQKTLFLQDIIAGS